MHEVKPSVGNLLRREIEKNPNISDQENQILPKPQQTVFHSVMHALINTSCATQHVLSAHAL